MDDIKVEVKRAAEPQAPGASNAPGVPSASGASSAPKTPGAPKTTGAPKTPSPAKSSKDDDSSAMLEKIFGSRTRAKLLRLFFESSDRQFFTREITRVIGEQVNSVRRELQNLESLGAIKKEVYDKKTFYTVDKSFAFYRPFVTLFATKVGQERKETSDERWQRLTAPVASDLQAVVVIERLPGDDGVELLLIGTETPGKKLGAWAEYLERALTKPIRYAIVPKADYFFRRSVRDDFLDEIFASDYKIVYDPANIVANTEKRERKI
ncbi:hypothetical protein FWG76_00505 [Candidatus Saccharibacteria bacterium]|nr:hypothetical protein [Candidatus Saccharibacteria bacterium]